MHRVRKNRKCQKWQYLEKNQWGAKQRGRQKMNEKRGEERKRKGDGKWRN